MASTEKAWYYDASTSRLLRLIAHFPVAGIGGVLLLVAGMVLGSTILNPQILRTPSILLIILLLLVGGPFSLAYLWPMLTDPKQRPSVSEFEGAEGFPFTLRSVSIAAVLGSIGILVAVLSGVPPNIIYWVVVAFVFSPLIVAFLTTHGELSGGELAVNRTEIPLDRIERFRSVRIRSLVFFWVSYVRRSGLFLPRVFTVPPSDADRVRETLEAGVRRSPEIGKPDRIAQTVVFASGAFSLAVGALAYVSVTDPTAQRYVVAILGGIGGTLCLLGLRGL